MATEIDSLQIRIVSNGENAANAITQVSSAVKKLNAGKNAEKTLTFLRELSDTMARIRTSSTAASALQTLAAGIETLKGVGSITKVVNNLQNIAPAIDALNSADLSTVSDKMSTLAQAMGHISGLKGLTSFGTAMKSLKDLPDISKKLTPEVLSEFADKVQRVSEVVTPLSNKMTSVASGFKAINGPIKQASESTKDFSSAISNINVAAIISNLRTGYNLIRRIIEGVVKLTDDVVDFDGIVERFKRGFGDTAGDAYSWIQRLNQEMGLNIQTFMQYTSIFSQMLEGLGVAQKDATQMAIGYSELSYDIWAAYNDIFESYGDAVSAVQSAIAGQTRPLRRAGFSVLNTTLQQTAANHGLEISITKATEAEKSYLRYLSLVDQAQEQGIIGTYAKEMETAEGQLRTLGQMFKSLTQEAGKLLLPLLTVVVPRVQAAVKLITEAIQRLAALFGVTFNVPEWSSSGGFTEAIEDAEDAAEGIDSAMSGAAGSAKELKKTLLGIDEINQLNGANGGSGGGGGGGSSAISDALAGYDWDVSSLWTEAIFDSINSDVDEIVAKFKDFLPILETAGYIIGGLTLGAFLADVELAKAGLSILTALALDVGLNIAFTELTLNTDMSKNPELALAGVLGQWLASAGAGAIIGKAIGNTQTGIGIGLAVGAAVQIAVMSVEIAKGNLKVGSENWWLQQLSTIAMGGAAGFALGGVTGLVLGLGVTMVITAVAGIIAWENGGRGWAELEKKFGEDLGLTDDELHFYAENVILTPRKVTIGGNSMSESDAVELLATVKLNLEQSKADIQSSMLELEKDVTKLRLGISVNKETLESDVRKYIESVQSYIDNTYQEGSISLSLLGLDDSNMQDFLDDWYKDDKLSRLTSLLNEVVTNGTLSLSNGFQMTIDPAQKAYVIADLQKQIQEIVDEAAQLRYDAQLTGLELRTSGELGAHELVSAIEEAVGILAERQIALDQSMDTDILIAKQAYLTALEEGLISPEEAEKIYQENLSQIFIGWATKTTELTQEILDFGLGKITSTLGVNIDTLFHDLTVHAQAAEGQTFQDLADDMSVQIGYMSNSVKPEVADAIQIIMEAMMPSVEEQQRVVSELQKAGQNVDKGLIDGINDAMLLATLYGDANAIMYTTGWQMSKSPTFYEALQNTKDAFANLDESARQGLSNNVSLVYDEARGLVITTSDGIEYQIGEVTDTVRANLEALGLVVPEGFVSGAKQGTDEAFGGGAGSYAHYLMQKLGIDLSDTITEDKFKPYGKRVISGFKSGATPEETEFNPTVQTITNAAKNAANKNFLSSTFETYGGRLPKGIKKGIVDNDETEDTVQWIIDNLNIDTSDESTAIKGMKGVGGNLVKGILKGMETESESETTTETMNKVVKNLEKDIKYVSEMGSPSKLFAREIGYYLTQGIVVGMDQPDALIPPMEDMLANATKWWDSSVGFGGGDFSFTSDVGVEHYMNIKDANNESNNLLREQNNLLRAILEKDTSSEVNGDDIIVAATTLNRRTGRTMIPVGG